MAVPPTTTANSRMESNVQNLVIGFAPLWPTSHAAASYSHQHGSGWTHLVIHGTRESRNQRSRGCHTGLSVVGITPKRSHDVESGVARHRRNLQQDGQARRS